MAETAAQARKQRELSKAALAADLHRLEVRVRAELDPRARLRRDAPRLLMLAGGAVLVVGALVVVRTLVGRRQPGSADDERASIESVTEELRQIRKALEKQAKGGSGGVLQKAVLRVASGAGSAGGMLVARRLLERSGEPRPEGRDRARAG